ncbi:hypothetical protein ACWEF6_21275 [Amycolatopsis sp. NPDC004772]
MTEHEMPMVTIEGGRRVVTYSIGDGHLLEHDFPDAVKPFYRPSGVNEDVLLFAGDFRFAAEEVPFSGDIRWRWGPTPRLEFRGSRPTQEEDLERAFRRHSPTDFWAKEQDLLVDLAEGVVPPQPTEAPEPRLQSHIVSGPVEQQVGDGSQLDSVTFMIPNGWRSFDATGICDPDNLKDTWHGRTVARGDGWIVTIDTCREMSDQWDALQDTRGYRFTHVGDLRRADGTQFTGDEAFSALSRVRLGLTIALGRRTTCALPVGYRHAKPVWCRWRRAPVDPYSRSSSQWMTDAKASRQVASIVGSTLDATASSAGFRAIQGATSYYMAIANDLTIELHLPTAISAMQLLAWHSFGKNYSKTQWNKMNSKGQVRELLNRLTISTQTPPSLKHLLDVQSDLASRKAADSEAEEPATDALASILYLRNIATHPTDKVPYETYSVYTWAEASHVVRHWLRMALLHAARYTDVIAETNAALNPTPKTILPPWVGA